MKVSLANGKSISLTVLPIEKILPHEDVIPALIASVKRDMVRTCFQRDPIVIDRKTKVVLDGMHRRAALSSIGARFAFCVEFDYLNRSVVLERWLRYFIAPDRKFVDELVCMLGLKRSKSLNTAMRAVDVSRSGVGLLSSKESYAGEHQADLMTSYRKLAQFDKLARSRRVEVQFHPENERISLFSSESVFVLYPPKLKKKQILGMAKEGIVLPFKTTRHILPTRPMGFYFPLNLLMQSSLGKCNQALKQRIAESRIDLVDRDTWYEGRRYSEPLAIFRRG
ncbi:MAG: hypothetical protein ACRECH_08590 [Nitrososphaerales archaeon]